MRGPNQRVELAAGLVVTDACWPHRQDDAVKVGEEADPVQQVFAADRQPDLFTSTSRENPASSDQGTVPRTTRLADHLDAVQALCDVRDRRLGQVPVRVRALRAVAAQASDRTERFADPGLFGLVARNAGGVGGGR